MSESVRYNLEGRTAKFGEDCLRFCKKLPRSPINDPLITQLTKCATSIGANYAEADDAESKNDFKHKIGICKKESRESKHFLRMFSVLFDEFSLEISKLLNEATELNLIFNSIYNKVKK